MAVSRPTPRIRLPDRIVPGEQIVVESRVVHPLTRTQPDVSCTAAPDDACFIREAVATYDDVEVARFEWTSGEAAQPVVSFMLTADREACLTMVWRDSCGGVFQHSVEIEFTRI